MFSGRSRRCTAVQHMLSTDQSYDNRTIASFLKMQIWIATNNRDVPRVMKTKFPATVMVFGVVSREGHIMPPHIWRCWRAWQTMGLEAGLSASPQVQRDPGLASEGVLRLCTILSLAPSSPDLNPLDYFVWSYIENITNMTSQNTKASLIAAIRRVFTGSRRHLWKRHVLSSWSVSRRWFWLHWIDVSSTT